MKHLFIFLLLIAAFSTSVLAANFLDKKVVKIGETVPDFQLEDVSGKEHQLSDHRGSIVMLHFWSATCPFVVRYDEELKKIAEDYKDRGVIVLGIDSNKSETLDQIKKVADERKVNYPVLIDSGNKIADQFGAITTPHVFLIDKEGKLLYEGAVDDQGWSKDNAVKKKYVREALDQALAASPISTPVTKSVGCTIKRF